MFKKWISLIMAAILLLTVPMQALADSRNTATLYRNNYTYREHEDGTISNVEFRTYENGTTEHITMFPGEFKKLPPFIAFQSSLVSFSASADPQLEKGQVSPVLASIGSGGNGAVGYPNADKTAWVEMTAKEPGTVVVRVNYNTPLTAQAAAQYEDKRASSSSSKTYYVTVQDNSLVMKLEFNSNATQVDIDWTKELTDYNSWFWFEVAKAAGISGLSTWASNELAAKAAEPLDKAIAQKKKMELGQIKGTKKSQLKHSVRKNLPTDIDRIKHVAKVGINATRATAKVIRFASVASFGVGLLVGFAVDAAIGYGLDLLEKKLDAMTAAEAAASTLAGTGIEASLENFTRFKGTAAITAGLSAGFAVQFGFAIGEILHKRRDIIPVAMNPDQLNLKVTLINTKTPGTPNGTILISDLTLAANENISFSKDRTLETYKPDRSIQTKMLMPGEEFSFEVPAYPKYKYRAHENASPLIGELYIAGICDYLYTNSAGESVSAQATAETQPIPLYNTITRAETDLVIEWAKWDYPNRSYYIMCPVVVELLDETGATVYAAESGSEETFFENGIEMGAEDDAKYICFGETVPEGYSVRITAIEDGSMTVFSSDVLEDGTEPYSIHRDIALTKGQVFYLDPHTLSPSGLSCVGADGQQTQIPATTEVTEETVKAILSETDISDWAMQPVAQALLRDLEIPIIESFQREVTVEEFSRSLLYRYDAYRPNPYDTMSNALQSRPSLTPATDIAKFLGLLHAFELSPVETEEEEDDKKSKKKDDDEEETPAEPVYLEWNGDAPITRGQAAIALRYALEEMGLTPISTVTTAYPIHEWADVTNGLEDLPHAMFRAVNLMYTLGIMRPRTEEPLTFDPDAPLTMEEAIVAINELDTICRRMEDRNNAVKELLYAFEETADVVPVADSTVLRCAKINEMNSSVLSFGVLEAYDSQMTISDDMYFNIAYVLATLNNIQQNSNNDENNTEQVNLVPETVSAVFSEENGETPVSALIELYQAGRGEFTDWDDSQYAWIPFTLKDENGGILNDEVYLYLTYTLPYIPESTAENYTEGLVSEFAQIIITDQDAVAKFLSAQNDLIGSYDRSVWAKHYYMLIPELEMNEVAILQQELKDRGFYSKKVNGVYDSNTEKAVKSFQKKNDMEQTGIATQYLMEMLFVMPRELERGDEGTAVRKVRQALMDLGYLTGKKVKADDEFDKTAVNALKDFQEANGLEATGVADVYTQELLLDAVDNTPKLLNWMERHP